LEDPPVVCGIVVAPRTPMLRSLPMLCVLWLVAPACRGGDANSALCLDLRDGMQAPRCDGGNPPRAEYINVYLDEGKSCEDACRESLEKHHPGSSFEACFDGGRATADDGGTYPRFGCEYVDVCACQPH
jgi:hypothetical protein